MSLTIIKKDLWVPDQVKQWNPKSEVNQYLKTVLEQHDLPTEVKVELVERASRTLVIETQLSGRLLDVTRCRRCQEKPRDHCPFDQVRVLDDLGIQSKKVITTAGVNALVDAFQGLFTLSDFKYHGVGTGTTAEAVGDTALVTELTTQYQTNNTRPTGTQTEGSSANIYKTVGQITVDATVTLGEHGIFNNATSGSGTLWDRSLISPTVGLNSGGTYEPTYQVTASAGG